MVRVPQGRIAGTIRTKFISKTLTNIKSDHENSLVLEVSKGQSRIRAEQTEFLGHHGSLKNWWVNDLPDESSFLTRGGAKISIFPRRRYP